MSLCNRAPNLGPLTRVLLLPLLMQLYQFISRTVARGRAPVFPCCGRAVRSAPPAQKRFGRLYCAAVPRVKLARMGSQLACACDGGRSRLLASWRAPTWARMSIRPFFFPCGAAGALRVGLKPSVTAPRSRSRVLRRLGARSRAKIGAMGCAPGRRDVHSLRCLLRHEAMAPSAQDMHSHSVAAVQPGAGWRATVDIVQDTRLCCAAGASRCCVKEPIYWDVGRGMVVSGVAAHHSPCQSCMRALGVWKPLACFSRAWMQC